MSRKFVVYTIACCKECKWKRGMLAELRCGQVKKKDELVSIPNAQSIPIWCPLEDVPEED